MPVTVSPTSVPATSTSTIGITFGAVASTCTSDSAFIVTTSGGAFTATSLPGVIIPSGGTTSVGVPCGFFGSVAGSSLTLQAPTTPGTAAVSVILASVGGESIVDSATTVTFTPVSASSGRVGGIGRGARKLRFYPVTITGTCAAAAAEPSTGVSTFGSATLTATSRNRLTLTVALRGATPDTTYALYVNQSGACSASPLSVTTNARGNGTGHARLALVSGATQLWVTATSATTAFVTPAVTLMAERRGSFRGRRGAAASAPTRRPLLTVVGEGTQPGRGLRRGESGLPLPAQSKGEARSTEPGRPATYQPTPARPGQSGWALAWPSPGSWHEVAIVSEQDRGMGPTVGSSRPLPRATPPGMARVPWINHGPAGRMRLNPSRCRPKSGLTGGGISAFESAHDGCTVRSFETMPHELDCVVVGGGAAGLSAAVNLGRTRRNLLLVDERDRFGWTHIVHNYLGFPDGIEGVEIRRLGWRHAARYGVQMLLGHVATATRDGDRFRLRIERLPEGGTWGHGSGPRVPRDAEMARLFRDVPEGGPMEVLARTVILATGVFGHFPEFPGRDECVGQSLFWCLYCEGYELIDRTVGVVGHDNDAVETALNLLDFTARVTIVAGRATGLRCSGCATGGPGREQHRRIPVRRGRVRQSGWPDAGACPGRSHADPHPGRAGLHRPPHQGRQRARPATGRGIGPARPDRRHRRAAHQCARRLRCGRRHLPA